MKSNKSRKGPVIKAAFLLIFLITAIVIVRFTPLREHLTAERLGLLLETAGPWAPAAYIGAYAAGVCLFMPGTLLATVGAAIFGPYFGFVYVWLGAMLGASLAFLIGRYLGRDFAASLIGQRLAKYDEAIERNGFASVLYLRLVSIHPDELRHGTYPSSLLGLFFRDGPWHHGRDVHFHLFCGNR
jgi:uncharacterized membrane protein YdjX (TVP38/TMEM64 family)